MKQIIAFLILALPMVAQTPSYGTTAQSGAIVDHTNATKTMPVKSGLLSAAPGSCTANKEFYVATDQAAGSKLRQCNSAGTGWDVVGPASGGSGVGAFYSSGPITDVGSAGRIWAPMGITPTVQNTANWQRVAVRVPAACTLKNLRVDLGAAQGSGGSEQVWIYAGPTTPSATALTCTIATGATSCSNTTDQPAVSAGDFIYVQDLNGSATANTYIMVSFQCN